MCGAWASSSGLLWSIGFSIAAPSLCEHRLTGCGGTLQLFWDMRLTRLQRSVSSIVAWALAFIHHCIYFLSLTGWTLPIRWLLNRTELSQNLWTKALSLLAPIHAHACTCLIGRGPHIERFSVLFSLAVYWMSLVSFLINSPRLGWGICQLCSFSSLVASLSVTVYCLTWPEFSWKHCLSSATCSHT